MIYEKPDSPFTPGRPVPPEFFVGRQREIGEILARIKNAFGRGFLENILIYGDRGIGKSSLAGFAMTVAEMELGAVKVHISLSECADKTELIEIVLRRIFEEFQRKNLLEKLGEWVQKYVRSVGLFGVLQIEFPRGEIDAMAESFDRVLEKVTEQMQQAGKTGLVLTFDDVNGLAEQRWFGNWYKGFSDGVAVRGTKLPLAIMLLTTPAQRRRLSEQQESLMRIFYPVEIGRLSDEEVEEFYRRAFARVGFEVRDDALKIMVKYASGLPAIMQEIGDAVFYADEDGIITKKDAEKGILAAAEEVGRKYLAPKIYDAIRSERYRGILDKLGKFIGNSEEKGKFNIKSFRDALNEDERNVLHNFLRKMRELGVIESYPEGGAGAYRFVNELFPIYIWLRSEVTRKVKVK
ncbi:MAG TPA: ATP-binding protein [candidate division Zixibacteria bacterium]|nr:ATP-binding protein [candidate division Zixibacteria bacterium]